jgi:hypothetical protein
MKKNNTFIIFATLLRHFDVLRTNSNTMHLHASVAAIRGDYDYDTSNNWESIISNLEKEKDQNILIIRVYPQNYYKFKDNKNFIVKQIKEFLFLIEITLDELIGNLIFDKTSHDSTQKLMPQIFGTFQAKFKDPESISSNCLFEFRNGLNMSNIATIFKLSNIDIGGGNISNRSALKSTQFNLSWFLIKLYGSKSKDWLSKNIIFPFTNNTSKFVLSTKVNKNLYDRIDFDRFKSAYPINYKPNSLGVLTVTSDEDYEFLSEINSYVENNAQYARDVFITEMRTQIPKTIKNIETKIKELNSQYGNITLETIKKGTSQNGKNKLKQQNNENELATKKIDIEKLTYSLNCIKSWHSKEDNWHLYELDTIRDWHINIVLGKFSNSKLDNKTLPRKRKKKKTEHTELGIRKYSTSSRNTYLREISWSKGVFSFYSTNTTNRTAPINYSSLFSTTAFAPIKFPSKSPLVTETSKILDTKLNKLDIKSENNLTIGFLNIIESLINSLKNCDNQNLENRKHEIQKYIESEWINIVKNSMSENKNLNSNLKKVIKNVQESVALANYKRRSNRIIPILTDTIENLEYVLITLALTITYHNKVGYTALAQIIGNNIIYYYYKKVEMKKSKKDNIEWNDFKKINNITDKRSVLLGDYFLTCFIFSGIIYKDFNSEESDIVLVKFNKDYLDEIKKNLIISPSTLPMLCEPTKWGDNKYGGFLENDILKKEIYTQSPTNKHKMENKKLLYNSVNYLNSIQFEINIDLLEFLAKKGNSLFYTDVDISESERLQQAITIKIAETYKNIPIYLNTHADWRGRLYTNSFFISYQGSDLSASLLLLYQAENLTEQGKESLYIYGANLFNAKINDKTISKKPFLERINWVKDNYLKIINLDIEFIKKAESKFLFAAFCLTLKNIHDDHNYKVKLPVFLDATCSGIQHLATLLLDKELAKKVNLTPQTNSDDVQDIYSEIMVDINKAINNYGILNPDFSSLADVKLTRDILKLSIMTKVYNVTTYGIALQLKNKLQTADADSIYETSKGGGKNINFSTSDNVNINNLLKHTWRTDHSGESGDLFKYENSEYTGSKTQYYKEGEFKKGKSKVQKADKRVKLFITPGLIRPLYLNSKEVFKIAEIIYNQIFELFPSLKSIYDYFMDISKLMIKLGIPLSWFTPVGLKLTQHYLKSKINKVSISMGGKNKTLVLREFEDKISNRKQIQAIIPNIIHSLDASHLIKLINSVNSGLEDAHCKMNSVKYVIPVHDCFGTHPNQLGLLEEMVKREYIWIYSNENFLVKFHNKIIKNIKDNNFKIINKDNKMFVVFYNKSKKELLLVPELPKEGNFNIQDILDSKYMIT